MTLTVNHPQGLSFTETACNEFVWNLNGEPYTSSGTYFYRHEDNNGCEQVDTLFLTVNHPQNLSFTETACDEFLWDLNGETYTSSGTYFYRHEDNNGCEQVDTLFLTVNHPQNLSFIETACGEFVWELDGGTYASSGTYFFRHEDSNGCEQVDTLFLTVNHPQGQSFTETACGEFIWELNGETYTASGTYLYRHEDNNGCEQVDTLHLTVNHPQGLSFTETACGEFLWNLNGETYTSSGTYLYPHEDNNGCEQVDTLYLTVNHPQNLSFTETACDEFFWDLDGGTYAASGTYLYRHEDNNGCEQVDTLFLTVNLSYQTEDAVTIDVTDLPFTYAGTVFGTGTQSGDFTVTLATTAGCDSVVTLHLTVNDDNSGDAFLTTSQVDEATFELTAFANQYDLETEVAIAYTLTKNGVPVNFIDYECGGDLFIGTEHNGYLFGQDVSFGTGSIPANTFLTTDVFHDYFYFHFLNGRANRISHTFTQPGTYVITFTLMTREGGNELYAPYFSQGQMLMIGGEGSEEGVALATATVTFTVDGGNGPVTDPTPAPNGATGIDDMAAGSTLVIFPNPARDIVTVRTSLENAACTVTDMSGKVVLSTTADASGDLRINVSQWADGVYFVNLRVNGSTVTRKLVITR